MLEPMNLETLDATTLQKAPTVTVAVPEDLLQAVRNEPESLGLPAGVSRRKGLSLLLIKGASAGIAERRDAEREAYYASLADDPERHAAAAAVAVELVEDGTL